MNQAAILLFVSLVANLALAALNYTRRAPPNSVAALNLDAAHSADGATRAPAATASASAAGARSLGSDDAAYVARLRAKDIRASTGLSLEERKTQLAALARQAQTELTTKLGADGYEAYTDLKGEWIRALQPKSGP
jgi:hypothetical protein